MRQPSQPEPALHRIRTLILFSLICVAFLALAVRCYFIQYRQHDVYVQTSIMQQRSRFPSQGCRGAILDRRGRVLAADNQTHLIFADPQEIDNPKETANRLAPILDMGAHIICKRIMDRGNSRFVPLKTDATREESNAVTNIRGIGVQHPWHRYYPMGELTTHVVGFTSIDGIGLAGIEHQYDAMLAGHPENALFLADVKRRPIRLLNASMAETPDEAMGMGVILSIDATIQQFVRNALMKQYLAFEAESAYSIVVNPRTGAILAMVSLPDFDPTQAGQATPAQQCNHAVTDQFEPGSVLKPIVTAIAFDAGVIRKGEKIFCENGHYIGKGFGHIKEYNYHAFGNLTPKQILMESSNIGMAKIGQRLGAEKLYKGLRLFGFGRKTEINLPGEAQGLLRSPDKWTGYSVTRIPFGQEISVTALQLVKAFSILANRGRVIKPSLIEAFVDSNGVPQVRDGRYEIANQVGYIINPEIAEYMVSDALCAVVNEGSGKRAKLEKWQVFGKTGTAQIASRDGRGYEDGAYIASFVAGAPVEDPAIVVLVSVRLPNRKLGKGYTGGTVSAPVAGQIIDKTLTYLESRGWAANRQ